MGRGGIVAPFSTLELDGGEWSASRPSSFTNGERVPGTNWIGDWVDPSVDLDTEEKKKSSCPFWDINPGDLARNSSLHGQSLNYVFPLIQETISIHKNRQYLVSHI
jgi:hypothetical protein